MKMFIFKFIFKFDCGFSYESYCENQFMILILGSTGYIGSYLVNHCDRNAMNFLGYPDPMSITPIAMLYFLFCKQINRNF